jgi:chromosome partitioning protein
VRIASVWNPKGGQGKSLLAMNLAACAASRFGLRPLVIDQDPQGTCRQCFEEGGLPFEVVGHIPDKAPENVDLVIVDHQASDWELPPAHVVVMPVLPSRTQFRTFSIAYRMLKEKGYEIITVVNNVNLVRSEEHKAVAALRREGAFVVRSGAVFGHAEAEMTTIFNDAVKTVRDAYKLNERRAEIESVLTALLREVKT